MISLTDYFLHLKLFLKPLCVCYHNLISMSKKDFEERQSVRFNCLQLGVGAGSTFSLKKIDKP